MIKVTKIKMLVDREVEKTTTCYLFGFIPIYVSKTVVS